MSSRIAYFDCASGIAGDMTVAALVDAAPDRGAMQQAIEQAIASLGLPGVRLVWTDVMRGGFRGLHLRVDHPEQHAHRHLRDMLAIVDRGAISPRAKALSIELFQAVARAEARVHGSTPEQIHFHEVGAIDSIVDMVATAVAVDLLQLERCLFSPIPTGQGVVTIAHGVCAIPTPGTAELLKGIPLADVPVEGELTTPTGAAIVRTLAAGFSTCWPALTLERIGYGAGTRDPAARANLLRVVIGRAPQETLSQSTAMDQEQVTLLETNLDQVSGELLGYTTQRLLAAGALDVYTTPIGMKKSRPGILLSVLCRPEQRELLEQVLFAETGTLGIRRHELWRSVRTRSRVQVSTVFGVIEGNQTTSANQQPAFSPEFEECAAAAQQHAVSLREVYRAAQAAFAAGKLLSAQDQPVPRPSLILLPGDFASGTLASGHSPDHDHRHDHAGHRHDHDHDHRHDHDAHR